MTTSRPFCGTSCVHGSICSTEATSQQSFLDRSIWQSSSNRIRQRQDLSRVSRFFYLFVRKALKPMSCIGLSHLLHCNVMPDNSSSFMAASRILYLFSVLSCGEIFVPHFGQSKSPFPLIFVRSTLNNLLVCNLISLQMLLAVIEPKSFTEQCSNRSFFSIKAVSQKTAVRSSSFLDACKSF